MFVSQDLLLTEEEPVVNASVTASNVLYLNCALDAKTTITYLLIVTIAFPAIHVLAQDMLELASPMGSDHALNARLTATSAMLTNYAQYVIQIMSSQMIDQLVFWLPRVPVYLARL